MGNREIFLNPIYFFLQLFYNEFEVESMNKKVIKIISIILVVVMLIGFLSVLLYI